jgi:hypothetical protein
MKLEEIAKLNEERTQGDNKWDSYPNMALTIAVPQMASMLCKLKKMRDEGVSSNFLAKVIKREIDGNIESYAESVIRVLCEELENDK